ncbi:MAG: cytochrome c peroxidase [Terriglobales bacterium]
MIIVRLLSVGFIVAAAALLMMAAHWNATPTSVFAADQAAAAIKPIGKPITIKPPLGLPMVPIPADNPPTAETIALGRRLYYDPVLSSDNTISCASCHSPETGFTDRNSPSLGVGGKKGTRHSPTVINSAYNELQFWDGRAASLEEQAKGPIANPVEMATTHATVVARLQADPKYVALFKQAWGTDKITIDLVVKSIASFERTVLCGGSDFDRFLYGHDKSALSESAQRGLKLFTDPKKGNCEVCHTIGEKYALFTDNKFHNLGIGADLQGNLNDLGRYDQTKKDADMGAFKTPTLRNIAQRAPYFHDGSFPTLKDALGHYIGGGNANAHLDKEMHELDFLSFDERDDILAFLNSLTSKMPENLGPPADLAKPATQAATKR